MHLNTVITNNLRRHLLEEVARFVLQQPPLLHNVVKQLPSLHAQSKHLALASRGHACCQANTLPDPHAWLWTPLPSLKQRACLVSSGMIACYFVRSNCPSASMAAALCQA